MFLEIGSLIFATLLFLWVYLSQKRPANFPPGPMGIPIFGYLPFLGGTPHKKLGEIGEKWGPIFSLYYGSYPIVVLNTLPIIKDALRRDTFSGRPNHLLAMELSRDGITFNDGPAGYEQRRFTLKTLRDLGFGKQSMEKLVEEEVHELVDYFGKNTNKPIELKHIFGLFVINALWSILVGDKFSVNDARIQELYRMCIEGFIDPEVAGSLWFLPWLAKLMPSSSGYNSVVEVVAELKDLFRGVVQEHKATFVPNVFRDFVDVYLAKIRETEDKESSFYGEVGENNLLHVLLDLFTAGSDTLNSSLNFALLYLCSHPEAMTRIQAEIDTTCGRSRLPTTSDRKEMPYTEAVISEVLRLSSIVVGAILHSTTEEVTLAGYTLPAGCIVMPNLYAVHHDPRVFPDPDSFKPERFLVTSTSSGVTTFVKSENVVPFSVGKRVCLAEVMAQTEFFLFLAGLLQRFNFKFADPSNPPDFRNDVKPGLVLCPKPFWVVVEERM